MFVKTFFLSSTILLGALIARQAEAQLKMAAPVPYEASCGDIPLGDTLTIPAGDYRGASISIYGPCTGINIVIDGVLNAQFIVFTSNPLAKMAVGPDIEAGVRMTLTNSVLWYGLYFGGAFRGESLFVSHTEFLYGGINFERPVEDAGTIEISDNSFTNNEDAGNVESIYDSMTGGTTTHAFCIVFKDVVARTRSITIVRNTFTTKSNNALAYEMKGVTLDPTATAPAPATLDAGLSAPMEMKMGARELQKQRRAARTQSTGRGLLQELMAKASSGTLEASSGTLDASRTAGTVESRTVVAVSGAGLQAQNIMFGAYYPVMMKGGVSPPVISDLGALTITDNTMRAYMVNEAKLINAKDSIANIGSVTIERNNMVATCDGNACGAVEFAGNDMIGTGSGAVVIRGNSGYFQGAGSSTVFRVPRTSAFATVQVADNAFKQEAYGNMIFGFLATQVDTVQSFEVTGNQFNSTTGMNYIVATALEYGFSSVGRFLYARNVHELLGNGLGIYAVLVGVNALAEHISFQDNWISAMGARGESGAIAFTGAIDASFVDFSGNTMTVGAGGPTSGRLPPPNDVLVNAFINVAPISNAMVWFRGNTFVHQGVYLEGNFIHFNDITNCNFVFVENSFVNEAMKMATVMDSIFGPRTNVLSKAVQTLYRCNVFLGADLTADLVAHMPTAPGTAVEFLPCQTCDARADCRADTTTGLDAAMTAATGAGKTLDCTCGCRAAAATEPFYREGVVNTHTTGVPVFQCTVWDDGDFVTPAPPTPVPATPAPPTPTTTTAATLEVSHTIPASLGDGRPARPLLEFDDAAQTTTLAVFQRGTASLEAPLTLSATWAGNEGKGKGNTQALAGDGRGFVSATPVYSAARPTEKIGDWVRVRVAGPLPRAIVKHGATSRRQGTSQTGNDASVSWSFAPWVGALTLTQGGSGAFAGRSWTVADSYMAPDLHVRVTSLGSYRLRITLAVVSGEVRNLETLLYPDTNTNRIATEISMTLADRANTDTQRNLARCADNAANVSATCVAPSLTAGSEIHFLAVASPPSYYRGVLLAAFHLKAANFDRHTLEFRFAYTNDASADAAAPDPIVRQVSVGEGNALVTPPPRASAGTAVRGIFALTDACPGVKINLIALIAVILFVHFVLRTGWTFVARRRDGQNWRQKIRTTQAKLWPSLIMHNRYASAVVPCHHACGPVHAAQLLAHAALLMAIVAMFLEKQHTVALVGGATFVWKAIVFYALACAALAMMIQPAFAALFFNYAIIDVRKHNIIDPLPPKFDKEQDLLDFGASKFACVGVTKDSAAALHGMSWNDRKRGKAHADEVLDIEDLQAAKEKDAAPATAETAAKESTSNTSSASPRRASHSQEVAEPASPTALLGEEMKADDLPFQPNLSTDVKIDARTWHAAGYVALAILTFVCLWLANLNTIGWCGKKYALYWYTVAIAAGFDVVVAQPFMMLSVHVFRWLVAEDEKDFVETREIHAIHGQWRYVGPVPMELEGIDVPVAEDPTVVDQVTAVSDAAEVTQVSDDEVDSAELSEAEKADKEDFDDI